MGKTRLGNQIKSLRESKGLSQGDIEKRTGIKREYISKIETGDLENPTYKTLQKLAKGIGVSVIELIPAGD